MLGLIFLSIFLIVGNAHAQTVVERDLPKTVEPNEEFKILLKLRFGQEKPNGVIIVEKVPEGFRYNSSTPKGIFLESFGELRWAFYGDEVFNRTIEYSLIAPNKTQKVTFEGIVKTVHGTDLIKGDSELLVKIKEATATPSKVEKSPEFNVFLFILAVILTLLIKKLNKA